MRCVGAVAFAGILAVFAGGQAGFGAVPAAGGAANAPAPAAAPAPGAENRAADAAKTPAAADEFEFRLMDVSFSRSLRYNGRRAGAPPLRVERISLTFTLSGPLGVELHGPDQSAVRSAQSPADVVLSALTDDEGNDLRGPDTRVSFFVNGLGRRYGAGRKADFDGTLNVMFPPPAGGSKAISLIEGYVTADEVVDKGEREIKPLKDNLDKDIALPVGNLRFNAASGTTVEYTYTPEKGSGDWGALRIRYFDRDGTEISAGVGRVVTETGRRVVTAVLNQPLADGAYAVATWPSKTEKIKLPFKAENVELP